MNTPVPVNKTTHFQYTFLQQSNPESSFSLSIHVIDLLLILHLIVTVLGGIDHILLVLVHIE